MKSCETSSFYSFPNFLRTRRAGGSLQSFVFIFAHATLVGADPNMEPVFILVAFRRFA